SEVLDVAAKAADLHRLIDALVALARREKDAEKNAAGPERHARLRAATDRLLLDEAERFGCRLPPEKLIEVYEMDLELNAQGLGVWLDSGCPGG
ncbi:MAG: MBL fold metallo-hydrolase, partial [Propionivibrio sp.]